MLLYRPEVKSVLMVGVIDPDEALFRTLQEFWKDEFMVLPLDDETPIPSALDVLVADPAAFGGHSLRFLRDLRASRPDLGLVLTYVYCDSTQTLEEKLLDLADASVVKPYDLQKLGQTVRWVAGNKPDSHHADQRSN